MDVEVGKEYSVVALTTYDTLLKWLATGLSWFSVACVSVSAILVILVMTTSSITRVVFSDGLVHANRCVFDTKLDAIISMENLSNNNNQ